MWGEREAHQLQCKPQPAQCSEKQQSSCKGAGGGGGLKFEKKMLEKKQSSPHLRKSGHRFPCILYFFIHPQPNNVGPARQQPRALFLISLNLVREGRGTAIAYLLCDYWTTWDLQ